MANSRVVPIPVDGDKDYASQSEALIMSAFFHKSICVRKNSKYFAKSELTFVVSEHELSWYVLVIVA